MFSEAKRIAGCFFLLTFCLQMKTATLQPTASDITAMTASINNMRAAAVPLAARMTCLTWNEAFATTVFESASTCTIPTGNVIYDVRSGAVDIAQIFNEWYSMLYSINEDLCLDVNNCVNYRALMSDFANSFACTQNAACGAGSAGGKCTAAPCTYTICMFDAAIPTGRPYTVSTLNSASCTAQTCTTATDPTKTTCSNFLCCTATTTTTTSSSSTSTTTSTRSTASTSTTATTKSTTLATSTSVMCGTSSSPNWWCAKNQAAGQSVASAVAADSCFCVMNKTQTQQQAFDSCAAIGGFLTDVQNSNENALLGTLLSYAAAGGSSSVTTVSPINTKSLCPTGATYYNGACYTYQTTPKTWQDAETYCQKNYNGHLPSIQSSAQQTFLYKTMANSCPNATMCPELYGFWIGGYNNGDPNNWRWSDNSPLNQLPALPVVTTYRGSGWAPQPENPKKQNCMTIVKPDGGWGDWYCYWTEPFPCQFNTITSMPFITSLIGLQQSLSGHYWNIGNNCQMTQAVYQGWDPSSENVNNTAYMYNADTGTWTAILPTATVSSAICRVDRNICGRAPCPSCSTCVATNNGTCYNCTQSTSSTTASPLVSTTKSITTTTKAPTATKTFTSYCNSTDTTTNWWCAKDHTEGVNVSSAVSADSCFCILRSSQTQQEASDSCEAIGGFLTDIQNSAENTLITNLLNLAITPVSGSSSSALCPANAALFNGSCYVYQNQTAQWQAAENDCISTFGGHLVSIQSKPQQDFLYLNLTNSCQGCPIYGFWVGGYCNGDPNNWRWTDGSKLNQISVMPYITMPYVTQYRKNGWAPQPNDPKNEQCMTIVQPDGGWGDWKCTYPEPYVCQFALSPSTVLIGLQKSISGHFWNVGTNCQMTVAATYQNWVASAESSSNTSYVLNTNGTWSSVASNASSISVCRKDRNICGRNPCPSCTCTPSTDGTCYSCGQTTTASAVLCTVNGATNWWCAKDHSEGTAVSSAVSADSCFCVMNTTQTQQQAFDSCSAIGGFLTDIENVNENNLVGYILNVSGVVSSTNSAMCPSKSTYFNGSCYFYDKSLSKPWQLAENYCQQTYGAHLATINSPQEQDFIFKTLTNNCSGCPIFGCWVGGNDYGVPTKWMWCNNQTINPFPKVTNYTGWAKQPEDPTHQQCMTLVRPDGGWGDWYCSYPEPFVCELPLTSLSAWIGLQKTANDHTWNIGSNCQARPISYTAYNASAEDAAKTAYSYLLNGVWSNSYPYLTASAAVCRLDRNICGRNNGCPSCSTCSSTNGGSCFSCGTTTSSTAVAINDTAVSTPTFTYACGSSNATTKWWCAAEHTEGSTVNSALQADSCFCVMTKSQNQQQAITSCSAVGGFLTDIQNADENALIGTLLTISGVAPTTSITCPTGASFYNGSCYIYNPYMFKKWQDAENYCKTTYGGNLPCLTSYQQQMYLYNMTSKCKGCSPYGFWVGGNNYGTKNWSWVDGTVFTQFPNITLNPAWKTQPEDPTNQQCITIVKYDGGAGDWFCNFPEPFHCQFPPTSSTSWIGLQRSLSTHSWSVGSNNCSFTPAVYQNWDTSAEDVLKTAYTYGTSGKWAAVTSATLATSAVCRMDRNICGRGPCPTCSTCTPQNSNTCYTCA